MGAFADLSRALRRAVLLALLGSMAAGAPAAAFSITNTDPQLRAKLSIDYWLRWVDAGESVVFHPTAFPVTVYVQFPAGTLTCEVTDDSDEVVISADECLVNGEVADQSTFRF